MHNATICPEPTRQLSAPGPDRPLNAREVIPLINSWTDLTPKRRTDLISDINTVVRLSGLPAANVLLTPSFLREHVLGGAAPIHGLSKYRMRNVRASVGYIMRRLGVMGPKHGPLSPAWTALLGDLDKHDRAALIGVARFYSSKGCLPEELQRLGADFLGFLINETLTVRPRKYLGRIRLVWNRCCRTIPGWPGRLLAPLVKPDHFILSIGAFPESYQADESAFGDRLMATMLDGPFGDCPDDADTGGLQLPLASLRKPLRPISAALRRSHARWAASALVATGIPITEVTALSVLVTPTANSKRVLRYLWERAGRKPSAAGMHVAEVLRMIAKYHVGLPAADVEQIRRWSAPVTLKYRGITPKNDQRVRAALEPAREAKLRELPAALMQAARKLLPESPEQACSLALRATAIGLLSRRPIRLDNLRSLRLDRHLQRGDPSCGRITYLLIPEDETKNTNLISVPIPRDIAEMLEEWIAKFRPIRATADCVFLFPGEGTGNNPIGRQGMRDAIKAGTKKFVGVELTPHQFRHLAARVYLQEFPGDYETVRRLLSHKSITTTIKSYCGIEVEADAERFDQVILNRVARRKRQVCQIKERRASRRSVRRVS